LPEYYAGCANVPSGSMRESRCAPETAFSSRAMSVGSPSNVPSLQQRRSVSSNLLLRVLGRYMSDLLNFAKRHAAPVAGPTIFAWLTPREGNPSLSRSDRRIAASRFSFSRLTSPQSWRNTPQRPWYIFIAVVIRSCVSENIVLRFPNQRLTPVRLAAALAVSSMSSTALHSEGCNSHRCVKGVYGSTIRSVSHPNKQDRGRRRSSSRQLVYEAK
jgi:hypothetical protein